MQIPNPGDIVAGKNFLGQPVRIIARTVNYHGDEVASVAGQVLVGGKPGTQRAAVIAAQGWIIEGRYKTLADRIRAIQPGEQLWLAEDEAAIASVRTIASREGIQTGQQYEVIAAQGGCWISNRGQRGQAPRRGSRRKAEPRVTVNIALPQSAYDKLASARTETGQSMAAIVAQLIEAMPSAEDEF